MNSIIPCVLLALLPTVDVCAGKYFDCSARAKDAYHLIFSLQLEASRELLDVMREQEPDNLIGVFLENYLEVLRIGLDDDEEAYHRLSGHMNRRLSQLSRGEPRSPYYRYTQAEIRLQWAVLHARFGDYLSSISDVKQAYALLKENDRRFPDFIANKKSLGLIHALAGNVPDDYRWAVRLLGGINGTIDQGVAEIESVLAYAKNHELVFETETLMAYGMLQMHLNNQGEKAWNVLKNSRLASDKNPFAAYMLASVALRCGHTDAAITLLQHAPAGTAYHPFYQSDFLLGVARLYRLDADANLPLQKFLYHFRGKNAIREAYQKLAWHHLLQGDKQAYDAAMWNIQHYGVSRSEPDKVALREANSGEIPDLRLLKARLLFDGGYYARAFDLLKHNSADYSKHPRNNLEYHYRMARIAHKTGQHAAAVGYYETAIAIGEKAPWYFACSAALQLGAIYEEKTDVKQARSSYQRCLDMHPEEYAASLHAKAKAGLNRLH